MTKLIECYGKQGKSGCIGPQGDIGPQGERGVQGNSPLCQNAYCQTYGYNEITQPINLSNPIKPIKLVFKSCCYSNVDFSYDSQNIITKPKIKIEGCYLITYDITNIIDNGGSSIRNTFVEGNTMGIINGSKYSIKDDNKLISYTFISNLPKDEELCLKLEGNSDPAVTGNNLTVSMTIVYIGTSNSTKTIKSEILLPLEIIKTSHIQSLNLFCNNPTKINANNIINIVCNYLDIFNKYPEPCNFIADLCIICEELQIVPDCLNNIIELIIQCQSKLEQYNFCDESFIIGNKAIEIGNYKILINQAITIYCQNTLVV